MKKAPQPLGVTVFEIRGMTTDTTPAAVGAATIDAVWKAIEYSPTEDEINHVQKVVFMTGYDDLPDFEEK